MLTNTIKCRIRKPEINKIDVNTMIKDESQLKAFKVVSCTSSHSLTFQMLKNYSYKKKLYGKKYKQ